jgi:hypothetical protein
MRHNRLSREHNGDSPGHSNDSQKYVCHYIAVFILLYSLGHVFVFFLLCFISLLDADIYESSART